MILAFPINKPKMKRHSNKQMKHPNLIIFYFSQIFSAAKLRNQKQRLNLFAFNMAIEYLDARTLKSISIFRRERAIEEEGESLLNSSPTLLRHQSSHLSFGCVWYFRVYFAVKKCSSSGRASDPPRSKPTFKVYSRTGHFHYYYHLFKKIFKYGCTTYSNNINIICLKTCL